MQTSHSDEGHSPWHAGERAVQERVGVAERSDTVGRRAVRSVMTRQHQQFFAQLPALVVGCVDGDGWPWASILSGPPGFVTSPDPQEMRIAALPPADDPLRAALIPGASLGLLGIDLSTRRRNRVNGRIATIDAAGCSVTVDQSFGNCAMYIQRRDAAGELAHDAVRSEPFPALDDAARSLITRADTFFVASCAPPGQAGEGHGADVSHRGGRPGFVGLGSDGAIVVPDYPGNHFFNTLGNLMVNPRAGLLFINFDNGDLLQVTGTAEIVWDGPEVRAFQGSERLWCIQPSHGRWLRGGFSLRLAPCEHSPHLLGTGTWSEARAVIAEEREASASA